MEAAGGSGLTPLEADGGSAQAHRAELEERFQRRVAEAEAIDHIVLRISASLDPESTVQSIVDAAATLSGAAYSSVWLRNSAGDYHAVAAHGVPIERLQRVILTASDGLMDQMRRTRQPAQVMDFPQEVATTPEARNEVSTTGTHATLGVPLIEDGDVVGALYVASTDPGVFPEDIVRVMQRLASFAQVALRNARRFSDVEAERSRLQAYLDAIPEAVLVFDRTGRVVLLNETLRQAWGIQTPMVGMSRDDVFRLSQPYSSRPLKFRFDPDAVFTRVLATGKPEKGLLELEDSSRTFEIHFGPLRHGSGAPEGIVATVRDITLPLELVHERTRSHLLTQLLDLSVLLNSNLSITAIIEQVVEAAMKLVGARAGTIGLLEGDRIAFRRFRTPDGWKDVLVAFHRGEGVPGHVWNTMQPYVSNTCASDPRVLPTGEMEYHGRRLIDVPMVDSTGKLVGTLELHDPVVERDFDRTDVEALRLLAHQAAIAIENARLNHLKDEFLSIVSHELKTPVTSIKGFAQVLKRRLPPESLERGARYLDVINHQADRLTGLINDLLDLSRIQSGRFTFETGSLNYGQFIRDVMSEMQLIAPVTTMSLEVPESVSVRGNADRLRQVLTNLIDNAVKYGPAGGAVRLTVEVHQGEIVTCVHDEGTNLPPEEAKRIFLPYYQVRESGRPQAKGLGLGLFISQQIVEAHGGHIWVDVTDHTSFCFTLPQA